MDLLCVKVSVLSLILLSQITYAGASKHPAKKLGKPCCSLSFTEVPSGNGILTSKLPDLSAVSGNREFKYYRLTDKGKKQLLVEESQWKQMAEAVARVMWPVPEES